MSMKLIGIARPGTYGAATVVPGVLTTSSWVVVGLVVSKDVVVVCGRLTTTIEVEAVGVVV